MKHTIVKQSYRLVLAGGILMAAAWGQQDPGQTTPPEPATTTAPAPAFGQEPPPAQITIAPPVTSLDQASLEPTVAVRSFLQPGVHLTETVNSNLGASGTVGITRILGSLDLTRIWSRYAFLADYVGGVSLYSDSIGSPSQVHAMAAAQRYSWRTGQLQVRDGLTYLPEGSFGFSGFNGAGGGGLGGGGGTGNFGGGGSNGSLGGQQPRLTNSLTLDLRESLNPRSSITAAGGYTFTDFLHSSTPTPGTINSRQISAQAGYSRVLNRFDQLGLQYAFAQFQFPLANAGSLISQTVEGVYEHQVSGRMDLVVGAGPQFLTLMPPQPASTTHQLSVTAHAQFRYRLPRESVSVGYNRRATAGSGIHFGSQTDEVRVALARPLSRMWTSNLDVGYAHNQALLLAATNSKGVNGSYQSGFAGGGLNRRLGRFFSLQMHYQYTYELFNHNNPKIPGGQSLNRNIGDITLSWHPSPIRLD